jgi:hypothetical protein
MRHPRTSICILWSAVALSFCEGPREPQQTGIQETALEPRITQSREDLLAESRRPHKALDEGALLSRGFAFDARHGACWITGTGGPCAVEAFVGAESGQDGLGYTCAKLNKATYRGNCTDGRLEGLAVVIADGTGKISKEVFLSYFSRGRMAYPALTSYVSESSKRLNLGVQEIRRSYGCVYFGDWDRINERDGCRRMKEIYGDDVFSEANARALRDGAFDLDKYRIRFMAFLSRRE